MHSPANAAFGCLSIGYQKAYATVRLSSTSSDESAQAAWLTPNQQLLVPCEYRVQQENQQQSHLQASQSQHQEQQHHSIQQTAAPRRCLAQPLKQLHRRHPVAACLHRQRTMNHNASEESEIAWCEFESLSLLAECEAADEMGTVQTVPAELSQPLAVVENHQTAAVTNQEGSALTTEELESVSYQYPISHPPSSDVMQPIEPSSDEESWELRHTDAQSDEATKAVQQPLYEHNGESPHVKSPETEKVMNEEAPVNSQSSAPQPTQRTSPAIPIAQQLVSSPTSETSVPKAVKRISTESPAESREQPVFPDNSLETQQTHLNSADNSQVLTGEEAAVNANLQSVSPMETSDSAINQPIIATMEASVNLPVNASVKYDQNITVKPGNNPQVWLTPDKTDRPVDRKSRKKTEKYLTKLFAKVFVMPTPDKQPVNEFGEEAVKPATKQPTGPRLKAELRNLFKAQAVKSAAGPIAKSAANMPLKSATKEAKSTPEFEAGAATEKRHAARAPTGNAADEATSKSYAKSFPKSAKQPMKSTMKSAKKVDISRKTVRAKPALVRSPAAAATSAQPDTQPAASATTAAAVMPPVRKWLADSALRNHRARPEKARAALAPGPGELRLDKPHQAAARLPTGKRAGRRQQPAAISVSCVENSVSCEETTYDSLTLTTPQMTPRSQSLCSDLMRPFRESQRVREKRREFGIVPDRVKSHQLFMALISADVTRMFDFHGPTVDRIARVCGCRVRLRRAILNRQTSGSGTWARFAQIEIDGRGPRSALVCDRLLREKFSCYEDRRVMRSDPRASTSQSPETLSSILKLAFIRQWSKSRLSSICLSGLQVLQRDGTPAEVSGGQVANEDQPSGEADQLGLIAADQRLELPEEDTE